jgi:hypothetical protein
MKTVSKCLFSGIIAAIILNSAHANAALTAYDGFNYPTSGTSVVGQIDSGLNASFGWSEGWADNTGQTNADVQGPVYVNATGLTYSKAGSHLVVSGGSVEQTDLDTYLPFRNLATSLGGTGEITTPQTVWVSFLVKNLGGADPVGTPAHLPTAFMANTYFLLGSTPNSASAPTPSNARYVGGGYNGGGGIGGASASGSITAFTPAVKDGNVHLIATRFIFGGGTNNTLMQIDSWLDPTPGVDPTTDPFYTSNAGYHKFGSTSANIVFNGAFFRGHESGQGAYDEIRIGETALDVLPVAPVLGDFDGDRDVDGADFIVWQTNYPTLNGATLLQGDADGDADVDGADFAAWQSGFPTAPAAGVIPIPEPVNFLLMITGMACIGIWRWRPRCRGIA